MIKLHAKRRDLTGDLGDGRLGDSPPVRRRHPYRQRKPRRDGNILAAACLHDLLLDKRRHRRKPGEVARIEIALTQAEARAVMARIERRGAQKMADRTFELLCGLKRVTELEMR